MKKLYTSLLIIAIAMLNLTNTASAETYTKITTVAEITDGQYVIGSAAANGTDATVAMVNAIDGNIYPYTAVTPSGNDIANPATSLIWTITKVGSQYTIQSNANSKYVGYTTKKPDNIASADATATDSAKWTVAYTDNRFVFSNVASTNRNLQYNHGAPRFVCYTGSQQDLFLYKKQASTPSIPYTVSFDAGAGTYTDGDLTESAGGAGITLPTPTLSCGDWTFAGWTTTAAVTETTTAPTTLLAGGATYKPSENCELFAVYVADIISDGGTNTLTLNSSSFSGLGQGYKTGEKMISGVNFGYSNVMSSFQMDNISDDGFLWNKTAFSGDIIKVKVQMTINQSSFRFGTTEKPTSATEFITSGSETFTIETGIPAGSRYLYVIGDDDKYCKFTSIEVIYSASTTTTTYNSNPECTSTCTTPTITFNGTTEAYDENNGNTIDLDTLFTSNSNGAVTYTCDDESGNVDITDAEFYAIAAGTYTVTATQAASGDYCDATATATIIISEATTETFTITLDPQGGTCNTEPITQENAGDAVTLPDAAPSAGCAPDNWSFAGWSTTAIDGTTTAPTLISSPFTPTDDITLYAVYKVTQDFVTITSDPTFIGVYENTDFSQDGITYGRTEVGTWDKGISIQINDEGNGALWNKTAMPANITSIDLVFKDADDKVDIHFGPSEAPNGNSVKNTNAESVTPPTSDFTFFKIVPNGSPTNLISIKINLASSAKTYDSNPTCLPQLVTPTGLSITDESADGATLSWTQVNNAESYLITIVGIDYSADFSVDKKENEYTFSDLDPMTDYLCTVTAIGDNTTFVNSEISATADFTTLCTDASITFDNHIADFDNANGNTIDLSTLISSNSDGAITYTCDNTENVTITDNSFKGTAAGTYTITATKAASGDYCETTATATITLTNTVRYTVTFDAGNGSYSGDATMQEQTANAGITIPETSAIAHTDCTSGGYSWSFAGWTTTELTENSTSTPDPLLNSGDNFTPTSDCNLYAVYTTPIPSGNTYERALTLADVTTGDYIIAGHKSSKLYPLKNDITIGTTFPEDSTTKTITDQSIVWRITKNGTNYTIYNSTISEYLNISESALSTSETPCNFTLSIDNPNSWDRFDFYNSTAEKHLNFWSNQLKFTSFASASSINLYKRTSTLTYNSNPTCIPKTQLATPTNLAATTAAFSADLSWTGDANAASHKVVVKQGDNIIETIYDATSPLTIDELTPNTEYTFSVTAIADPASQYLDSDPATAKFTTPEGPKYTITLNAGSGSCSSTTIEQNSYGEALTLPDATPSVGCSSSGWTFAGWTTSAVTETTNAQTFIESPYTPTSDINLYAVYKQESEIDMTVEGDGTKNSPYNVEQVIALNNPSVNNIDQWVIGYIIGTRDNAKVDDLDNTISNFVLSIDNNAASTFDATKHITVDYGTIEEQIEADPLGSFGRIIKVKGDLVGYFSNPGVKSCDSCEWVTSTTTYNSNPICTEKLATPTNLSANPIAQNTATLSWDAVTNADSYTVKVYDADNNQVGSDYTVTASTTSQAITGLTAETAYSFTVQAMSNDISTYNHSDVSDAFEFTTADKTKLATPTVTASANDFDASLSWTAVPNAASYDVVFNGGEVQNITDLSITFNNLTPATAYSYSITAVATENSNFSNSDAATDYVTTGDGPMYTVSFAAEGGSCDGPLTITQ